MHGHRQLRGFRKCLLESDDARVGVHEDGIEVAVRGIARHAVEPVLPGQEALLDITDAAHDEGRAGARPQLVEASRHLDDEVLPANGYD